VNAKHPRPQRRSTLYSFSETELLRSVRPKGERRIYARHAVGFPIRARVDGQELLAVCSSYSRRGLLFLAPRRLHLGKRIEVELPLGGNGSASVWLEVLLMRVHCDPQNRVFSFPTAALIKSHLPALVHEAVVRAHARAA
jgi:hypothetical protein